MGAKVGASVHAANSPAPKPGGLNVWLAFLKQSHRARGKFIYKQEAGEGLEGGCCREFQPGQNSQKGPHWIRGCLNDSCPFLWLQVNTRANTAIDIQSTEDAEFTEG